jgi:hypothetical protein
LEQAASNIADAATAKIKVVFFMMTSNKFWLMTDWLVI